MRFQGFVGASYLLRGSLLDAQRCVNLYPEVDEIKTGKEGEPAVLYGTPGLELLASIGSGTVRGLYTASNGSLFAVVGGELYLVASDWTYTLIDGFIGSTGVVQMVDNGTQLFLTIGQATVGYMHVLGSDTVGRISPFDGGGSAVYQDTYFISNAPGTSLFYISDNLDGASWSALDFAAVEGNPDRLVAMLSNNTELWCFGERTTEVYYNSGNADFPFERISGALMAYGCSAPNSPAKINNTVFWLGSDDKGYGTVWAAKGFIPQRISTHAVEFAIQGYGDMSTATAYTYQDEGHVFYCLNFPDADTTWCYDATTNAWHERARLELGQMKRWNVENHASAYGVHVVGDCRNNNIYRQSLDVFTENGNPIQRIRSAPHIQTGMKRVWHQSFQLDIRTGMGLAGVQQGTAPVVALSWSNDGGMTWTTEQTTALGRMGAYTARAIWRRLGQARDRVYRIRISDPVRVVIVGAEVSVVRGTS